jgi:ABC-type antimicrobial peptide transport system permease subunit
VRLALGAQAGRLIGFVMRKGVMQLGLGTAFGIGLAALIAGQIELILFEVSGRDPAVFDTVVTTLLLTGLLACFIPARRVTRVDPAAVRGAE